MNKRFAYAGDGHRPASGGWTKALRLAAAAMLLPLLQLVVPATAQAQPTVNIAQVPLLALKSAPGLVMLTMSRDQRLYYAAYNDSSDLNGDGVIDVGFKPGITYYGYFATDRCYAYDTVNNRFSPKSIASAADGCFSAPSSARWHGNWLNWVTMSRMDALRRVLYGGYRESDPANAATPTILQGAFIPRDAHVWGKEYRPVTGRDLGVYLIQHYTALAAPNANRQHLFIVKSPNFAAAPSAGGTDVYPFPMPAPNLRIITNANQTTQRIWDWAAGDGAALGQDNPGFGDGASTPYTIKVEVCVLIGGLRETGCTGYPTSSPTVWKPTGTLHDFALSDGLKFGLLTGSYTNNYSGGVVRRNIASFSEEVNPTTGQWRQVTEGSATVDGIARTIDRLSIFGWSNSAYYCGSSFSAPRNQGACQSWGAPVSEMMYEGLRYFSGKGSPTTAFINGLAATTSADTRLGLPLMGTATSPWRNPYRSKTATDAGNPICSRPVQMVIADPITSYDSDQLPGTGPAAGSSTYFPLIGGSTAVATSDLTGWGPTTLSNLGSELWTLEGLGTRNIFIGQSAALADGNPTAKSANTFYNIRGHAPDGAQAQGSYYAAPVARFARTPGIDIGAPAGVPVVATVGGQKVDTISVALGTVVPKIQIPSDINRTRYATIVPIAKSVSGAGVSPNPGNYQATGTITGFYLDYSFNTTGPGGPDQDAAVNGGRPIMSFAVNFSDSDEGTDNESDAIVRYTVLVLANGELSVSITPVQTGIAGIQMQIGYAISGTTKDGLYLDMRTLANNAIYYLDTLTAPLVVLQQDPAPATAPYRLAVPVVNPLGLNLLPLSSAQTFRTLTFNTAGAPAAAYLPHDPLWYAAKYGGAGIIDSSGDPTNYFKITSPANLPAQMGKAFRAAAALAAVASTSVVGVGQRSLGSAAIYQANYDSLTWSSRLYAFRVQNNGDVSDTPLFEASSLIPAPVGRTHLFLGRGGSLLPQALTSGGFGSLNAAEQSDFGSVAIYQYLLGDKTGEERKGGALRNRGSTAGAELGSVLGDIVNSDPQIITKKDYGYGNDSDYSAFLASLTKESLAVGTNNGFFHIFDATPQVTGGAELFGFIPQAARPNIKDLASPAYSHRYFVDGAIGQGHAKIPVPGDASVAWRTVVVTAGGAGAKTVFAVNAPSSQIYSANNVLWEINENTTLPTAGTLGNVMGRPQVGKLANGTWVAIFGNGYNSPSGTANLFVVRLSDGVILKEIPTNNTIVNNGLGSTELVKITTGFQDTIEYVYGADYKGNIWRFNLGASDINTWPATAALVYTTPTGRPITAEIKIGAATGTAALLGNKMVYFGTGTYLNANDSTITSPAQALYGIYDNVSATPSNSTPSVVEANLTVTTIAMASATSDTRTTSIPATPWYNISGKKGWVLVFSGTNVTGGERVIAPPVRYTVSGKVDAFLFTSIVPGTDDCVAGIDAWITGIDAMTGGYAQVFDGLNPNSVKVTGGSPRGVFVLQDGGDPSLYISQTIFNGNVTTTSYTTSTGGNQTVTINGTPGQTRVLGIKLTKSAAGAAITRQVWRQLK